MYVLVREAGLLTIALAALDIPLCLQQNRRSERQSTCLTTKAGPLRRAEKNKPCSEDGFAPPPPPQEKRIRPHGAPLRRRQAASATTFQQRRERARSPPHAIPPLLQRGEGLCTGKTYCNYTSEKLLVRFTCALLCVTTRHDKETKTKNTCINPLAGRGSSVLESTTTHVIPSLTHLRKVEVRRLSLQQLDDGAPHRPHVARRRGARHLDDLRRHPVRRADLF